MIESRTEMTTGLGPMSDGREEEVVEFDGQVEEPRVRRYIEVGVKYGCGFMLMNYSCAIMSTVL